MKRFLWFFWAMAAGLQGQTLDFRVYGPQISEDYHFDQSAFLPAERLLLQDVRKQLPFLESYEDFLDFLQRTRPGLLANYVLIHDTGSLQYADLERPRTILFGDGLMLAFSEDPRRSDRTVEIIAFEDDRFRFAELNFSKAGIVLEEEPQKCQSCHGATPKPLWDPYDFWPNAFGSSIARFGTVAEKSAYEALRLNPGKTGVYPRLKWMAAPVLAGIESFTQYVNQLQTFAALRRWQNLPQFAAFAPAILGVVNNCSKTGEELAGFFPEAWRERVRAQFPAWLQEVKSSRQNLKNYQSARYKKTFGDSKVLFPIDHERLGAETLSMAQLYFVLEIAGIDARDFTLSQGPNPYFLTVPSNRNADLSTDMALAVPELFQKLKPNLNTPAGYGYTWALFNCQSLRAESLNRLAQEPLPVPREVNRLAPSVFGECISCHSMGSNQAAPAIPFDQTKELRAYLQTPGAREKIFDRIQRSGPGQMPPYRRLQDAESQNFRANLERIAE